MLYSVDLRKKVMLSLESHKSKTGVYKIFNICRQTLYNWIKLKDKNGNLLPFMGFKKGYPPAIKNDNEFEQYMNKNPDQTQEEIALFFNVISSTISRTLKRIGYTRKKKSNVFTKR